MTKGEMMVSKVFSAQWVMAVCTTVCSCLLTVLVVLKRPDMANGVVPVFFTTWGIVVTHYFKRDRTQDAVLPTNKP